MRGTDEQTAPLPGTGLPSADDPDTAMAIQRFGGAIDVLVNNVGVGHFGAVEDSDADAVRAMFELRGVANMRRALLLAMRERKSGTIVNISSITGLRAFPSPNLGNLADDNSVRSRCVRFPPSYWKQ